MKWIVKFGVFIVFLSFQKNFSASALDCNSDFFVCAFNPAEEAQAIEEFADFNNVLCDFNLSNPEVDLLGGKMGFCVQEFGNDEEFTTKVTNFLFDPSSQVTELPMDVLDNSTMLSESLSSTLLDVNFSPAAIIEDELLRDGHQGTQILNNKRDTRIRRRSTIAQIEARYATREKAAGDRKVSLEKVLSKSETLLSEVKLILKKESDTSFRNWNGSNINKSVREKLAAKLNFGIKAIDALEIATITDSVIATSIGKPASVKRLRNTMNRKKIEVKEIAHTYTPRLGSLFKRAVNQTQALDSTHAVVNTHVN